MIACRYLVAVAFGRKDLGMHHSRSEQPLHLGWNFAVGVDRLTINSRSRLAAFSVFVRRAD